MGADLKRQVAGSARRLLILVVDRIDSRRHQRRPRQSAHFVALIVSSGLGGACFEFGGSALLIAWGAGLLLVAWDMCPYQQSVCFLSGKTDSDQSPWF